MDGTRKIEGCINCGDVREIAAHGLCFRCYRREDRAKERQLIGLDRHNPGIRPDHKRMFRGFSSVMTGLSDLGVSKTDVLTIRRIIDPYLDPIAKYLAAPSEQGEIEGAVNSEQRLRSSSPFTGGQELKHEHPKAKEQDEIESDPSEATKKVAAVAPAGQRSRNPKQRKRKP